MRNGVLGGFSGRSHIPGPRRNQELKLFLEVQRNFLTTPIAIVEQHVPIGAKECRRRNSQNWNCKSWKRSGLAVCAPFVRDAHGTLINELLALLGGRAKPVMAHFVKTGKLTLEDVKETEKMLRDLARKDRTT
jgi:hypothetical protein